MEDVEVFIEAVEAVEGTDASVKDVRGSAEASIEGLEASADASVEAVKGSMEASIQGLEASLEDFMEAVKCMGASVEGCGRKPCDDAAPDELEEQQPYWAPLYLSEGIADHCC